MRCLAGWPDAEIVICSTLKVQMDDVFHLTNIWDVSDTGLWRIAPWRIAATNCAQQ
jgi:hypothetical protein